LCFYQQAVSFSSDALDKVNAAGLAEIDVYSLGLTGIFRRLNKIRVSFGPDGYVPNNCTTSFTRIPADF